MMKRDADPRPHSSTSYGNFSGPLASRSGRSSTSSGKRKCLLGPRPSSACCTGTGSTSCRAGCLASARRLCSPLWPRSPTHDCSATQTPRSVRVRERRGSPLHRVPGGTQRRKCTRTVRISNISNLRLLMVPSQENQRGCRLSEVRVRWRLTPQVTPLG